MRCQMSKWFLTEVASMAQFFSGFINQLLPDALFIEHRDRWVDEIDIADYTEEAEKLYQFYFL